MNVEKLMDQVIQIDESADPRSSAARLGRHATRSTVL